MMARDSTRIPWSLSILPPACWPFSMAMPTPSTVAPASRIRLISPWDRAAVGQEIVDNQNMILRPDVLFGNDYIVYPLVGKGFNLGGVHLSVDIDALSFFRENHGTWKCWATMQAMPMPRLQS